MAIYAISYQAEYTGRHRGNPFAVVTAETPQQALHRYLSDKRRGVKQLAIPQPTRSGWTPTTARSLHDWRRKV